MSGKFVKPDPNTSDPAEKVAVELGAKGFIEAKCRMCAKPLRLAVFNDTDADNWDPLCKRHAP